MRVGRFPHPRDPVYPATTGDLPAAGRLAAEHFAERNFQHVGFIGGLAPVGNFEPLYEAFRTRAIALGCECHLRTFPPFSSAERALPHEKRLQVRGQQILEIMKALPKPVGMLAFSDNQAAEICVRSLEAGFDVPGDVAIIGIGNDPMVCECTPVPLSAVEYGGEAEGEAAIRMLLDLMAGQPGPTETVQVTARAVTVRHSTDGLATTDPMVAQAVRYLWDHLSKDVSVDDVAAAVGAPRRRLERAFRAQLGRSINVELRRQAQIQAQIQALRPAA